MNKQEKSKDGTCWYCCSYTFAVTKNTVYSSTLIFFGKKAYKKKKKKKRERERKNRILGLDQNTEY